MKILYAVQGTGNGHLARAMQLVPELRRHAEVEVLLSGYQSQIQLPFEVNHRYQGLSFIFGKKGGIDLAATLEKAQLARLWKDVEQIRLDPYDLIINDFEPVSAWAARRKGWPCLSVSHQAAVLHPAAPKPRRTDAFGKMILEHYAPAALGQAFHFQAYAPGIATPIIRDDLRMQRSYTKRHALVYLPAYEDETVIELLQQVREVEWHLFSKTTRSKTQRENVWVFPIDQKQFQSSLLSCRAVLCGAGFELPAEALFLRKSLMVVPMKRQYEQQCNAAALRQMGVPVLKRLSAKRLPELRKWVAEYPVIEVDYPDQTAEIVERLLDNSFVSPAPPALSIQSLSALL